MQQTIIHNAIVINEGKRFRGGVIIEGEFIKSIFEGEKPESTNNAAQVIDAEERWLIPGAIDDQVHFREPGLTHKGEIATESKAALAGGVTSYMEMPNTNPQSVTHEELEKKYARAAEVSAVNYSFYMGATNKNLDEVLKTDPRKVCGIKVFMGSSTGNMLVDDEATLAEIFKNAPTLIATHCEDEAIIKRNIEIYREKYGEVVPISRHPKIRSAEACYKSSSKAVELAAKYDARLHVLHISSAQEMDLFQPGPVKDKKITAEVCVHHLWFDERDYLAYGTRIKWNPAVKSEADKLALWDALLADKIDVIATDHAPHTLDEKSHSYFKAPSGGPLVQHSVTAMFEFVKQGKITAEEVVKKMCHAPADLFRVDRRGYIREGYYADLVLINPEKSWTVCPENIIYKCGWSPFEGTNFSTQVSKTFVNGQLAYDRGHIETSVRGKRLEFNY
ncbi:dihydroorotase [Mangrovibacterium marinum]|uniref:Dihydroorotase n=1 Tax=Mangrovibacterium marinum TaxID=1639118 RepID=A0A2T5BZI2_9BACT|nr:dihydroorotase [Mangrovibacterium marinum]PTN07696.1 dihydroorotase [Mangrovibacterium marinum]